MKSRKNLYGLLGLLSLLGFIGVFGEEKIFLVYFVFALDFEYFFIKTDEMLVEYMNKSAARAFYCGMAATAVVTLLCFFVKRTAEKEAFTAGLAVGWGVSVAVYALSTAYYGFKENWGIEHDKKQN